MKHLSLLTARLSRRALGTAMLASLLSVGLMLTPVLAAQFSGPWVGGPNAAGTNSFLGFVESPLPGATIGRGSAFEVRGWVVDTEAQGWAGIDDLHVYTGIAGQGGTFLGKAAFGQHRPEIGEGLGNGFWAGSGFNLTVAANTLPVGPQNITVYAHTPGKGWWLRQVAVNVVEGTTQTSGGTTSGTTTPSDSFADDPLTVVLEPVAGSTYSTEETFDIKGYSLDRNAPEGSGTGVDRVDLYLDGTKDSGGAKHLGTANLGKDHGNGAEFGSQFANAGWDLQFKATDYDDGEHRLHVYAHSSVTDQETHTEVVFTLREPDDDDDDDDDD